jgi:hypothetical protein
MITPELKDNILRWLAENCQHGYFGINTLPFCQSFNITESIVQELLLYFERKGFVAKFGFNRSVFHVQINFVEIFDFLQKGGFTFLETVFKLEVEKLKLEVERLNKEISARPSKANLIQIAAHLTAIGANLAKFF